MQSNVCKRVQTVIYAISRYITLSAKTCWCASVAFVLWSPCCSWMLSSYAKSYSQIWGPLVPSPKESRYNKNSTTYCNFFVFFFNSIINFICWIFFYFFFFPLIWLLLQNLTTLKLPEILIVTLGVFSFLCNKIWMNSLQRYLTTEGFDKWKS